jgi:hypothetical protein
MGKIVPIGGRHMSPASMLAEIMNDEMVEKCVVVTILKDGDIGTAQYEMTVSDMCYAAALIQRIAFEEQ